MSANVLKMLEEKEVKFVDLRFTDTRGKEQHVSMPAALIDEDFFRDGKMFDGSSIAGWKGIEASDMVLRLRARSALGRQARRGVSEVHRYCRCRLLWSRAGVLRP
jgi:glutamine synthetase